MSPALISALLAQALVVDGGASFSGDVDVLYPGWLRAPYVRHSVLHGWGASGISLQTSQAPGDINATLELSQPQGRTAGQAWLARNAGVPVGQLDWDGMLSAGSQNSRAAFMAYGPGSALTCQPGAWGCYVRVSGAQANKGFHGQLTVDNAFGNQLRDGGLALEVRALGKTHSYERTVLAQDVYGNLTTYGGLIGNYLEPSDFDTCGGPHGFDNPGPSNDSAGGVMRPLGLWGYNVATAAMQVCTSTSAARDGGYERLCTAENGFCSQLPPGLTVHTNNDALYLRQHLEDGGTRQVVLPWSQLP